MPIDTSKVNQKISVPAGQIIFEEGSAANSLNIIHEGAFLIERKINNVSIPLLQIAGKNLTPGVISLFTSGRYPCTIKTVQDSIISTYQVNSGTIRKTIQGKVSIGIMTSRTLLREILEIFKKANVLQSLNSKVTKLNDNLSLSYFLLEPTVFPGVDPTNYIYDPELEMQSDPILRLSRENLSNFIESGGILPESASLVFLNDDHHELLKKEYLDEIDFDDEEFLFIRKILSVDPAINTPLFEADVSIIIHMCEKLSSVYARLLEILEEQITSVADNLSLLCGRDNSLLEKYNLMLEVMETGISDQKPEVLVPMTEAFHEQVGRYLQSYRNIFYKEFQGISTNFNSFKQRSQSLQAGLKPQEDLLAGIEANSNQPIRTGIDMDAMKKELENSASKILNFVKLPPEQIKEFSSLILKLKSMSNPLDPESDARKIRKNIAKTYWEVYDACFQKFQTNRNVPKQVEMMLNFGFFDETLLEPSQTAYLYTYKDDTQGRRDIPIHSGVEWLEQIFNKKITTSLDEMGQTYFDKIKLESKEVIYKRESDIPSTIDTSVSRFKYEMHAMYQPNVRLTTGNPATHLPILTKYHITIPLEKCAVTKKVLSETIQSILQTDYTAFNREIVYNDEQSGIRKEFVQRSIIPDFILVPSLGGKVMMWQDLSILRGNGSKESRGRIILPLFSNGDIRTMMLEAIAAFRWELCKNILGPDWNNPGIPSITSEYMDYIQFYKKSKDISIELKEKIATEFKRFRTDRDKFVNDYLAWIRYESEGIQRLNRLVRGIFYKHIPFQKEIRDKVSKLPAYADMHNRFTNIRNRQFKEFENRYKKYATADGSLPPVLQENLDFYKI
ncbi:MAG: cyclic nucleotide-binding domain-containing protein [Leptospiraceae bacterium]|nr:cyclic nucleotide-binding domain-containing protein [Leptospiraceae bacterium]